MSLIHKDWYHERIVPDKIFFLHKRILREHLERYNFVKKYIRRKNILDVACGCGYGSFEMAKSNPKSIIAGDLSQEAINYANVRYKNKLVRFLKFDATKIPIKSGSIDVVVSFETLEHIKKQNGFLNEIKRVLKKDGALIISTPNKEIGIGDTNSYHFKEFNFRDFEKLLKKSFRDVEFYAQKPVLLKYIRFVNSIERRIKSNILRVVIDIYFKSFFINERIFPMTELKKGFTPTTFLAVCKI